MAICLSDNLAKITGETSTDNRFTNWLWLLLKTQIPAEDPGEFNSPNMRDRIAEVLTRTPWIMDHIVRGKDSMLVDKKYLNWIIDSKRQRIWIESKTNMGPYLTNELRTLLSNRELSILMIDHTGDLQTQKYIFVSNLRHSWELQEKEDHAFDWFKEEEEEKCRFAWDFLCKKSHELLLTGEKFRSLDDLITYTYIKRPSKELIELLVKNAKSRWSQRKYRNKQAGKKQYNFILSDSAIKRLDKLAEKYDLKRTQILEILLQMEAEEGIYLPKKIKILMNS